jgi:hypothetical protein
MAQLAGIDTTSVCACESIQSYIKSTVDEDRNSVLLQLKDVSLQNNEKFDSREQQSWSLLA